MKSLKVLLVVMFLCSTFFSYAVISDSAIAKKDDKQKYDKLSIIVKFRDGITKDQRKEVVKLVEGRIKDKNKDGKDDRFNNICNGNLAKIELKKSKKKDMATDALSKLRNHPYLEYAEYNNIRHATVIPNDVLFSDLWGLHNTGQSGGTPDADIDAPEAWDITTGNPEFVVGVIDTGIDYNHPDLAANMWTNPNEIPANGIDDDNNGFIDDVHGINAIDGSGDPMDDHFHGTHCAGTIGAVGNDNYGVAGVCWNIKLVGMKFLNYMGSGDTADAIICVNYAIGLKNNGVKLDVLSNSWGGGGYEQSMVDAITAANNAGILFVAAAGNDGFDCDAYPHYPSSYDVPNVMAIAATDHNDGLADFSNYGATSVDMGAPGDYIKSTVPDNMYGILSGTSMATPHVAGAAALVLSYNFDISTSELKSVLMNSGDAISSLSGKCVSGKRLNVFNAINQAPAPAPSFFITLLSPVSQSVVQPNTATYTIGINSIQNFSAPVDFTYVATPPINANVTFNPNPGTPGSTSDLNIVTSASTAPGDYEIEITATSGSIVRTRTVNLQVIPGDLVQKSYSKIANIAIPDDDPTGINSSLDVPDSMTVWNSSVTVNITHTWPGDLIVKLISPLGTEYILHDRVRTQGDDLHKTYDVGGAFRSENSFGTWTLHVSDNMGLDVGTLDDWTLNIEGSPAGPVNLNPVITINSPTHGANFSPGTAISFDGTATDNEDGDISSSIQWTSSVDGNIGSGAQFSTSSLTTGAHVITASVTDSGGRTAEAAIDITVGDHLQVSLTNSTQESIPDNDSAGIVSTLDVPHSIIIDNFSVEVNITHTWQGDLIVKLVSPQGTEVILHNRTGSSTDNIYETYYPVEFNGENSVGTWLLYVSDNAPADMGTLDSWTLNIEGNGN